MLAGWLKALVDVWSLCQTWSIGVCSVSVSGLLSSVQSASSGRQRSRLLPRNNRASRCYPYPRTSQEHRRGEQRELEWQWCSLAVNSRPGLAVQYCLAPERRVANRRACASRDRWCLAALRQLRDRGWRAPHVVPSATWLILPVVICLSQRLSHACASMNASAP